jgi:hypothetical protein
LCIFREVLARNKENVSYLWSIAARSLYRYHVNRSIIFYEEERMIPEGEFNIPQIYPDGGPLRWQDEISGVLPTAMKAFINHKDKADDCTTEHLEIVRRYCEYYINAPCFITNPAEGEEDLKASIKQLATIEPLTPQDLDAWLWKALEIGIDPL